jgi:hypothetical protein
VNFFIVEIERRIALQALSDIPRVAALSSNRVCGKLDNSTALRTLHKKHQYTSLRLAPQQEA